MVSCAPQKFGVAVVSIQDRPDFTVRIMLRSNGRYLARFVDLSVRLKFVRSILARCDFVEGATLLQVGSAAGRVENVWTLLGWCTHCKSQRKSAWLRRRSGFPVGAYSQHQNMFQQVCAYSPMTSFIQKVAPCLVNEGRGGQVFEHGRNSTIRNLVGLPHYCANYQPYTGTIYHVNEENGTSQDETNHIVRRD